MYATLSSRATLSTSLPISHIFKSNYFPCGNYFDRWSDNIMDPGIGMLTAAWLNEYAQNACCSQRSR